MAWYEGTYSCGHDGRVNIVGPSKDREWKRDRAFRGLCPDCYKKQLAEVREKENQEAAERSAEMELPNLTGSEKQVAWANTLRLNTINKYESAVAEFDDRFERACAFLKKMEQEGTPSPHTLDEVKFVVLNKSLEKVYTSKEEISDALDHILGTKTDARFWIDNRCDGLLGYFVEEYRRYKIQTDIPDDVKKEIETMEEELTVVPEQKTKDGVVRIVYETDTVIAKYVKDDDFREIVKKLNYSWEGCWCRKITEFTGAADDRIAELGNALLAAGFTVAFPNMQSKILALNGKFVQENKHWIKVNVKSGKLAITWRGQDNTLYGAAKKISGARWDRGSMMVPMEFYGQVQDFADTLGFRFSNAALREIEKYKEKESLYEKGSVVVPDSIEESVADKLAKSLKSDKTIIEDLVDDI